MSDPKPSPLEELYTDSGAFDAHRVASVLKHFLSIQRSDHAIFFSKEGHGLKNEDKMLAFCLALKLLKTEGVQPSEGVSAKQLHEATEIPKGTIDPLMLRLKKAGLLIGGGSNYEIPMRKVSEVVERLEKYL